MRMLNVSAGRSYNYRMLCSPGLSTRDISRPLSSQTNIAQMNSHVELNDDIMRIKAKGEKFEDKYAIRIEQLTQD